MYAFIWRHLPGPLAVRVLLAAAIVAAIVAVLFAYVFPWVEPMMPFSGNTVH